MRSSLFRPLVVLPALAIACIALVGAQPPAPALHIISPAPDDYVSGPIVVKAWVEPPSTPVGTVSFFIDDHLVCRVERPPYECPWNAPGGKVEAHQFRVTATVPGYPRLVKAVRTKGIADYIENVNVDSIWVPVIVTDDRGEFVKGLPKTAFKVRQDGIPQTITHFPSGDLPLELTGALDVSGSMIDAIPALKAAVRAFIAALKQKDELTLLAFNDTPFVVARASADSAARQRAVDRLAAFGGTALYDVMVQAAALLGKRIGRRALVVFSDGEDTTSRMSQRAAEDQLMRSDTTVYTIAQGKAYRDPALRAVLERLARTSGGRAFASEDIGTLGADFDEILRELSNQYLLAYEPPDLKRDGAWHKITVEVNPAGYHVRAKEGYLAPGGSAVR